MNRALGLINVPKVNWSSRSIVSVFLLICISLFLLLSKANNAGSSALNTQNGSIWIVSVLLFMPVIGWSIFEIFRLIPHLKTRWSLMIISGGIILSPEIFLIAKSLGGNGGNGGNGNVKQYAAALIISALTLFVFSSFIYGKLGISDYEELRQKCAFRRLLICAHLFWNSLFFSTWIGELSLAAICIFYVIANDILAYFFGKTFGKRKVFKWSPQKTLEGFVFPAILLPVLFQIIIALMPSLNVTSAPTWAHVSVSLLMPWIANAGDLFFSAQKRVFKVKDYGRLLGDQGGFWDRFDSHTFSLFFLSFLTIISKSVNQ